MITTFRAPARRELVNTTPSASRPPAAGLARRTAPTRADGSPSDPVGQILGAGRVLAIVGGVALLVIHLANAAFLERRLLNANLEGTVWTWASVVAAFGVALGAGLHALLMAPRRAEHVGLAGAAAFLSMDDLTGLHEAIAGLILTVAGLSETWDSVIWPVVYLPVLGAVVLLIERLTRDAPARIRHSALAGLALLAFAVAIEAATAPWSGPQSGWVHVVAGGLEEAAEQAGWILLAVAMLASVVGTLLRRPHSE